MSVIATVYIPEGIIMAADSRITGYFAHTDNNVVEQYALSDNGQKVFLLSKRNAGISVCGAMEVVGQTIADFIREFEITHVKSNDTIQQIAESLKTFVHQKEVNINIIFHVTGYDGDEQKVFYVNNDVVQLNKQNVYGANWNGDINHLSDLINGKNQMQFDWKHMYLKDGVELAEFMVDVNCKAQKFSVGVATCGGPIDLLLITKDNAQWVRHKILKP